MRLRISSRTRALVIALLILLAGLVIGHNWSTVEEAIVGWLLIAAGVYSAGVTIFTKHRLGIRDW